MCYVYFIYLFLVEKLSAALIPICNANLFLYILYGLILLTHV